MQAAAAPALPVDAATIISWLIIFMRAVTTALARSLNDALGLRLSSLNHNLRKSNSWRRAAG
jgi:hypothetical protein